MPSTQRVKLYSMESEFGPYVALFHDRLLGYYLNFCFKLGLGGGMLFLQHGSNSAQLIMWLTCRLHVVLINLHCTLPLKAGNSHVSVYVCGVQ